MTMSTGELQAMGHRPMSPIAASRLRCIDCVGSPEKASQCIALACPSWPFRAGADPC
jgi:hypothetical protein